MAQGLNFEVIGMAKVQSFLKGKGKEVIKLAEKGIKEAGFFMEGEIKASIAGQRGETESVDTGAFKNSLSTDNSKKLQSKVSTNVKYGPMLEFGTSNFQGRSHFGNSANRNKQKVTEFIQNEVNKV